MNPNKGTTKEWLSFLGALGAEACLFAVFYLAAPVLGSVPLAHFGTWLAQSDATTAFLAVIRLGGLMVSAWLVLTSLLYALAALSGSARAMRSTGWMALPAVRKLLDGAAGAAILVSAVTASAGGASAASAPPTTVAIPLHPDRDVTPPTIGAGLAMAGGHVSHPGLAEHPMPATAGPGFDPSALSPSNGFAGLAPGTKVYVVEPGDCLSVIAEAHLGDWRRDTEIDALNHGRPQADGRSLLDDHWIYPGWVLVMPPDATDTLVVRDPATAGIAGASAPAPGSGPAAPTPTPVRSGQAHPSVEPTPTEAAPRRAPDAGPADAPPRHDRLPMAPMAGVGGLAAAAVIWGLDRRRRVQMHGRATGRRVRRNPPAVVAAEAKARAIASSEAPPWVQLGLEYLGRLLSEREQGAQAPSVVLVRAGSRGLEVMVSPPCPSAPGRFQAVDDGVVWALDPEVSLSELESLAGGWWSYAPAVVSLGETSSGTVLANLEHAGSLALEGDAERIRALGAQMALELDSAPWAEDWLESLNLVGDAPVGSPVTDPESFVRAASRRATGRVSRLDRAIPSLAALRCVSAEDKPEVAVCFGPSELTKQLCEAADPDRSGLAVVVVGAGPEARWRLVVDSEGNGVLHGLAGEVAFTMELAVAAELNTIGALGDALEAANDPADEVGEAVCDVIDLREAWADRDRPSAVEVAVLGEVRLRGDGAEKRVAENRRSSALSMLAFLATHSQPASAGRLAGALWPLDESRDDLGEPAPKTVSNVLSFARALLGPSAEGTSRIILSEGTYRLHPEVGCDLYRFEALVAEARNDPDGAAQCLRQALELVEGAPFGEAIGDDFYRWVCAESLDVTITAEVVDAATQLAALSLEAGDFETVYWAADKALVLDPTREELYRLVMHARGGAGELDGVQVAYTKLCRALRAHLDELQEPSEDTKAVWRSYTRPARSSASPGRPGTLSVG